MIRLLLPLAFVLFSQCSSIQASKEQNPTESELVSIQWGKSFGMCRGYCFEEFTFTPDSVYRLRKSWQPELHPQQDSAWKEPAAYALFSAHANFDSLQILGDRLGCPDCADGGSEWLAFRKANRWPYS